MRIHLLYISDAAYYLIFITKPFHEEHAYSLLKTIKVETGLKPWMLDSHMATEGCCRDTLGPDIFLKI